MNKKLLGSGRSGKVFLVEDNHNFCIARKIFFEDKIANLIHYFFFGAPNPYVWNEDALKCAYYRRKILSVLVQLWFGNQLRIAEAINTGWNKEFKAYQLDTEFIQGRHVALHQPFSQERDAELYALVHRIMKPLQKQLANAGFDGLVWQAGKGSPSALNNFLLESCSGDYVFVWIDLESGVPALFPLNPLALFLFYLPKSIEHQRPLFDDVDIVRLKRYVDAYKVSLEENFGSQQYLQLLEHIYQLEHHQRSWKAIRRVDRSIQYQFKKGNISEQQANWYSNHPVIWYGRELGRVLWQCLINLTINLPLTIFNKLKKIQYKKLVNQFFKFILSQQFRFSLARKYVTERVNKWRHRKQLTNEEADSLLSYLTNENTSDYLNDFGVHIGIKTFVKGFEYLLVPLLYTIGLIDEIIFAIWLLLGGPIYRSIYTSFRMVQTATRGQEVPWIAFLVGLFPTIGSLAYPCQLIYSATGKQKKVAQFIVYDFFTRLGAKVPGWGGEDTLTEHFFNHCADIINRRVS